MGWEDSRASVRSGRVVGCPPFDEPLLFVSTADHLSMNQQVDGSRKAQAGGGQRQEAPGVARESGGRGVSRLASLGLGPATDQIPQQFSRPRWLAWRRPHTPRLRTEPVTPSFSDCLLTDNEQAAEQLSSAACFPHISFPLSGAGAHPQGTSECAHAGPAGARVASRARLHGGAARRRIRLRMAGRELPGGHSDPAG